MNDKEDKELYERFLNGDIAALENIVMKYKNNLMYFILKYVKNLDLAEDIFQNVVVHVLEKKEQYDFKYSLKTYLYTIAKSKALNCIKKNNNYTTLNENDIDDKEGKLLEDIIFTQERKKQIISIMSKLNEEHQQVIYLTIIEGLSYRESAQIMGKNISQIKNLVHRARTKMKKLLIEEKVIEIRNNKIIKLLVWILLVCIISSGVVYATIKIHENIKGKANLVPTYTGKIGNTDYNSIWIGTFNLAWSELIEQYVHNKISFKEGNTALVDELNKQTFKKEQISEEDYYIKVGQTSEILKNQILEEIKNKFGINNSTTLEKIDFKNASEKSITIYSLLLKSFEFLQPFDRVENSKFGDNEETIKYFGINNSSNEELNENLEVLFYNNENDFAIKLKTKENERIILYRTEDSGSFENYYEDVENKTKKYEGKNEFGKHDELMIPYISIDTIINYDELCGKFIEGEENLYIQNALQNVKFTMNESGGKLSSEATIKGEVNTFETEKPRCFYFDKTFVIFLKEENKEQPYMSLKVDNTDILEAAY